MNEHSVLNWVDTHAHLDDPVFDSVRTETLVAARARGVNVVVNIGCQPARWENTIALAEHEPGIGIVLGVHPGNADEGADHIWTRLHDLASDRRVLAIGEAGLDFYRTGPERRLQEDAFRAQIRLAVALGKPLVIHQRAAESELMALLNHESAVPRLILHSFDGSARYGSFAKEIEAYIGVGGLATKTAATELRSVLASVSSGRIILETDSPYLIPRGARGRFNAPANIPIIARHVAPLWNLSETELAETTTANAQAAFNLHASEGQGEQMWTTQR